MIGSYAKDRPTPVGTTYMHELTSIATVNNRCSRDMDLTIEVTSPSYSERSEI